MRSEHLSGWLPIVALPLVRYRFLKERWGGGRWSCHCKGSDSAGSKSVFSQRALPELPRLLRDHLLDLPLALPPVSPHTLHRTYNTTATALALVAAAFRVHPAAVVATTGRAKRQCGRPIPSPAPPGKIIAEAIVVLIENDKGGVGSVTGDDNIAFAGENDTARRSRRTPVSMVRWMCGSACRHLVPPLTCSCASGGGRVRGHRRYCRQNGYGLARRAHRKCTTTTTTTRTVRRAAGVVRQGARGGALRGGTYDVDLYPLCLQWDPARGEEAEFREFMVRF